jgi:hypothetical protein
VTREFLVEMRARHEAFVDSEQTSNGQREDSQTILALIDALENERAMGIHTCGRRCGRPMCVLRRDRDEWKKKATEAAARLEVEREARGRP